MAPHHRQCPKSKSADLESLETPNNHNTDPNRKRRETLHDFARDKPPASKQPDRRIPGFRENHHPGQKTECLHCITRCNCTTGTNKDHFHDLRCADAASRHIHRLYQRDEDRACVFHLSYQASKQASNAFAAPDGVYRDEEHLGPECLRAHCAILILFWRSDIPMIYFWHQQQDLRRALCTLFCITAF